MEGLILLAALWFLMRLVSRAGRKAKSPTLDSRPEPMRPPRPPAGSDPTQQEGTRLELMLRDFERALEHVGATNRPTRLPPPRVEEPDEGVSLEMEPEVISLEGQGEVEGQVKRVARRRVDQDEQAEGVAARRIKAAAARDTARSAADHAEFEQRIRQEPADQTATRAYTVQQLRDAVVWREILGPPVSLRRQSEPDSWP